MSDQSPQVPGGPQLRIIAMPRDTNAGDSIFGDWTLSQMDLASGKVTEGVFTYVAIDEHGHPRDLPAKTGDAGKPDVDR